MHVMMSSRRTVMSGEVVTFAVEFRKMTDGVMCSGHEYEACGPFNVSASRDAVTVNRCELRTPDQVAAFKLAIECAEKVMLDLRPTWVGGVASKYPSKPTKCIGVASVPVYPPAPPPPPNGVFVNGG